MNKRNTRRTHRRSTRNKSRSSSSKAPIAIGAVAAVALVTAGLAIPKIVEADPGVAAVVIYQVPDAQTSAVVIPSEMKTALTDIANAHNSIMVARCEGDGSIVTTTEDWTPRTASGDVLNVPALIDDDIAAKITTLAEEMNRPSSNTASRSLYRCLLQARQMTKVPVYVLSPSIDLAPPIDFRDLAWDVPVEDVIQVVNAADVVPDMSGASVTFVMTAPAGDQQMRASTTQYAQDLWEGLILNAGASSVTFIAMAPGEPGSDENVPVVPLPELPGTPVPPVPDPVDPEVYSCTLNTTAGFVPDTATLLDEDAVRASLTDCVARMTPGSQARLDGWVAFVGEIGPDGKPTTEGDVGLSQRRCDAIKALLMEMGVPEEAITTHGHGAVDQPDAAHPTSQNNRVVVITVTPAESEN